MKSLRRLKRGFDVIIGLSALFLLMPLMGLIALMVRLRLGTPILFRQQRPGLRGKPFVMYKFRTMTDARDAQGNLLPDAERLTPFGKFLRSTSLDELPHVILNTSSSVDHDCRIGNAVHIAPGAHVCGGVRIGDRALIGAGSAVIQNIQIGADVIVGAGATVVRDVPDSVTVLGPPARIVQSRKTA